MKTCTLLALLCLTVAVYSKVNQVEPETVNQADPQTLDQCKETKSVEDISLNDLVVKDSACPPPKYCDFEQTQCGWWNQGYGDEFNWLRHNGGTPSLQTGPSTDHTTGTEMGQYMYCETSWPRKPGDTAILRSKSLPATVKGKCFNFWYHLHGWHVNQKLEIFLSTDKTKAIWSRVGNQGTNWLHGQVTIKSKVPFYVQLKGTVGKNFLGDIAVDDLWFDEGECPQPGGPDDTDVDDTGVDDLYDLANDNKDYRGRNRDRSTRYTRILVRERPFRG